MNKKALVTGATGFVGSNLVNGLLNDGWQVDIIIRPSSDLRLLSDIANRLNIHQYDGDINVLINVMAKLKPDVMFHVASLFLSDHRSDQVDALIQSNILFGTQLLEAMSNASVKYLVNTSTYWEHYENKAYSPVNLYAATKKAFQDIQQYYIEAKGIQAITLKLFDTYGSNDPRPKLLNLLFKIAETEERIAMTFGEQKIDLVHIDDVVKAYLIAANKLLNAKIIGLEIYEVASMQPISIRDLVEILERHLGKEISIDWGKRLYRSREVMVPCYQYGILPDWKPDISLDEGIKNITPEGE